MKHHPRIARNHIFYTVLVVGFVYNLHAALPVYINSSFLKTFTTDTVIGWVYTLGALITVVGFIVIPKILEKIGNYRAAILLILTQIAILCGIISVQSTLGILALFTASLVVVNMISFVIDVFLESATTKESTGNIRGLFLTTINTAWVFAPMLSGSLAEGGNYIHIYAGTIGLLVPLLYLVQRNFHSFKDAPYNHERILTTAKHVFRNHSLRKIFSVNIILQTFYAWMVIYSPLYLHEYIGFEWDDIGVILTIMLLPFVLMDWPLGKLADKKYGEKELMSAGFFVMGISTIALAFIDGPHLVLWSLGLLATRIGATTAETMIETYFFKRVPQEDTHILGLFRVTRPAAYIIAPALTFFGLMFFHYSAMFIVIGILCLFALRYTLSIRDTN